MPMTTEQLLTERRERRQREQAERDRLERLRQETGAVEVRLHHIPVWFARRCRAWLRDREIPRSRCGDWYVVQQFAEQMSKLSDDPWPSFWWLDHHGSSENGSVFVNEPYANDHHHQTAELAARELGLELTVTERSWWNPGSTTRFEFRRPEGEK